MRISKICILGVALVLLLHCFSNVDGTEAKRQRKGTDFNLKPSLSKIFTKLKTLLEKLDLCVIINSIVALLTNCLSQSIFPEENGGLQFTMLETIGEEDGCLNMTRTKEMINSISLTTYCNTPDFKQIHVYIWEEDEQAFDMLKFFTRFGYPNAYEAIVKMYEGCPQELIETIPNPHTTPVKRSGSSTNNKDRERAFIRQQVLESNQKGNFFAGLLQNEDKNCNILKIVQELYNAGALDMIQLVQILMSEFSTDPALHFLLGKIQEPVKGHSFRGLREMTPVRELFRKAHTALIADPGLKTTLNLVRDLLGLDLINTNIVETVAGILEYILWQNDNVIPPYEPLDPPSTTDDPTTADDTTSDDSVSTDETTDDPITSSEPTTKDSENRVHKEM